MHRNKVRYLLFLVPVLALSFAVISCGGKPTEESGGGGGPKKPHVKTPSKPREGLAIKERGTLTGKVTVDGSPDIKDLQKTLDTAMREVKPDPQQCLAGADKNELSEQTWMVDDNGGVANVFVWLRAPDNKYFELSEEDKKTPMNQVIDQPHCAYIPHAAVLFPEYYDPKSKEYKPTGQELIFKNSAGFQHNVKWQDERDNGKNELIPSKGEYVIKKIEAEPENLIKVACTIHTFMRAYVRAYDHPFAAVTDKHGNYKIEHVPVGVPLQIVVWHESEKWGPGGKDGKTVTLKDGEKQDFTIKAK